MYSLGQLDEWLDSSGVKIIQFYSKVRSRGLKCIQEVSRTNFGEFRQALSNALDGT